LNARADRFPLFDGVRGLAALSVLWFHVTFGGFNTLPSPIRELAGHLDVGVTIFFVISGFLLYRPFVLSRFRGEPLPRIRSYAVRRVLRIVPCYWVALTVVALWLGKDEVFTASGIPTYYGFLQAYADDTFAGGIGQAWTLCVEVAFYVFLPIWALAMHRVQRRPADARTVLRSELAGIGVVFAASSAYLVWVLAEVAPTPASPYVRSFPGLVDQFALGMALAVGSAWLETRETMPRAVAAMRRAPSAAWLVAAVAFAGASSLEGGVLGTSSSDAAYVGQHELYSLTAVAVVFPAVLFGAGRGWGFAGRVLGSRALMYAGLFSYGIYLYHVAVVDKLAQPVGDALPDGAGWQTLGLGAAVMAVTVAIAALSYYVVERPALSLKSRFPLLSPAARGEAITEPAPATPPVAPRQP
jgi:peptidoglycan/LPS O-acetylase OafA/YrhL